MILRTLRVREFQSKGDIRHLSSFLEQLEMLRKDMSTLFNKAHAFQNEAWLLGWPVSEFAELVRIEESMKPFIKMGMSAKNFKESHREWLQAYVFDLNMDSVKQSVSTMISSMLNVVDRFEKESPSAAFVCIGPDGRDSKTMPPRPGIRNERKTKTPSTEDQL